MAISPKCDGWCSEELHAFGAILLGPPDASGYVLKRHLCTACYLHVLTLLAAAKNPPSSGRRG